MKHTDWEMQRERLSAYLDGEATPTERAALEAHLDDCAECQRELAGLRQSRALLRALPTPPLPRAFTLPAGPASTRRGRVVYPRWARPAQALGGVAAMIGLGLLVTTSLPHPTLMSGGAASSAAPSQHAAATTVASPTRNFGDIAQTPFPATPTPTTSATASGNTTSAPTQPSVTPTAPLAPVSGGLLLVGGAAVVTAGSVARRRARRAGQTGAPDSSGRAS